MGVKTRIDVYRKGAFQGRNKKLILSMQASRIVPAALFKDSRGENPKLAKHWVLAFARVRSEELLRLTWTDAERRKGFIEISAGRAKTARRRLIAVAQNLAAWLAAAKDVAARTRSGQFADAALFGSRSDNGGQEKDSCEAMKRRSNICRTVYGTGGV